LQIVGKELNSFSDFLWQLYILEHKLFNVSWNKWWWRLGSYDFVHFSMVSQRS
jgi:membrane associated rhomboid family serine protease